MINLVTASRGRTYAVRFEIADDNNSLRPMAWERSIALCEQV